MPRRVRVYEAVRGEERITGMAREIANRIGADKDSVYEGVRRKHPVFGWTVRQTGILDRRIQYAAYHVSDIFREDPVTGDAEEVAECIGIGNPIYIRTIADTGRITKGGYCVERIKGGDQA